MVVGEVIGVGKELISQVTQLDTMLIFIIVFVAIIISYKVFKFLMKAFITGMAFGFLPILANFLGFPIGITFGVIFQFMLFGIIIFIIYSIIHGGLRVVGFVLSPFRRAFKKKPKEVVVIKEAEKERGK